MSVEWTLVSLAELYDIRSGLSKPAKDFGSGYPFLSFKDVFYNYFVPENLTELVQTSERERESCSVRRGDVFLTRTSETVNELGMSSVALKDYEQATFNGFSKRLRPKAGTSLLPEYVGYYLRSLFFRKEMMAFSNMMSTRASLNNEMIGRLRLLVPPPDKQESIARILKSLDDKITLNRQINQTLEEMARTIFKSWFVDFDQVKAKVAAREAGEDLERAAMVAISGKSPDELGQMPADKFSELTATAALFPDELVESELGMIPRGWRVSTIGDEVSIFGGATPSTKNGAFWKGGTFFWATPKDLSGMQAPILYKTQRQITKLGVDKISSGQLPSGTVLMSSRAPVGYLAISAVEISVNQGFIAMFCDKSLPNHWVYQWLASSMDQIKLRASGTTFSEISKKNFKPIPVIVPTQNILAQYEESAHPLFSEIEALSKETENLEETRDTLLPRLLSGEIDLNAVMKE